jgi:CHAD domain-containing protein
MRLAAAFGVHPDDDSPPRVWAVLLSPLFKAAFDQTPVRTRPNTPPVRDLEHRRKHRLRKTARASRKRNRA